MRILRNMLRTTLALALIASALALVVSETTLGKPLLTKAAAVTKAKQTLVTGAKAKGVKVKTVDARATCTADAHFPNTFSCKLSERRKRCKGTTSIYAQGAVSVARARDTRVTCSKQR